MTLVTVHVATSVVLLVVSLVVGVAAVKIGRRAQKAGGLLALGVWVTALLALFQCMSGFELAGRGLPPLVGVPGLLQLVFLVVALIALLWSVFKRPYNLVYRFTVAALLTLAIAAVNLLLMVAASV